MSLNHIEIMTNGWYSRTPVATVGNTPSNDPTRSVIRQAVLYALRNRITAGGSAIRYSAGGSESIVDTYGYFNTIKRAYDPIRQRGNMEEFPACNVKIEDEFCDNVSNVQMDQNQALLHNSFILSIDCFLNNTNDPALEEDRVLGDIQKYFGINYTIPDENGYGTAFNCYYDSSVSHGIETNEPEGGILIRYRIWYRQELTEPEQSG